eukprot:scaffold325317_cov25-Prasinocladus_malaysianus.AAC.1
MKSTSAVSAESTKSYAQGNQCHHWQQESTFIFNAVCHSASFATYHMQFDGDYFAVMFLSCGILLASEVLYDSVHVLSAISLLLCTPRVSSIICLLVSLPRRAEAAAADPQSPDGPHKQQARRRAVHLHPAGHPDLVHHILPGDPAGIQRHLCDGVDRKRVHLDLHRRVPPQAGHRASHMGVYKRPAELDRPRGHRAMVCRAVHAEPGSA